MIEKWQQFKMLIQKGEPFVSASIVEKKGSSPRHSGARMLVGRDLSVLGTIGGGRLEADIISAAEGLFKKKVSKVQPFELTGKDAAEMDMICGGKGEMLMVYIEAADQSYESLLMGLSDCEKMAMEANLLTMISENGQSHQCIVRKDGKAYGSLLIQQALGQEKPFNLPESLNLLEERLGHKIYCEKIETKRELYLFGAGHVSQKLAPIAESVGFHTVIIDDRLEYANLNRFPNSKVIVVPSLEKPLPFLPINENSYVAIMTRGHLHDMAILRQVLGSSAAYIGMIGSQRKRDLIYKNLLDNGCCSQEQLEKVSCPIGLDIMADSPEEIAVSIVAELIKVRAARERTL